MCADITGFADNMQYFQKEVCSRICEQNIGQFLPSVGMHIKGDKDCILHISYEVLQMCKEISTQQLVQQHNVLERAK